MVSKQQYEPLGQWWPAKTPRSDVFFFPACFPESVFSAEFKRSTALTSKDITYISDQKGLFGNRVLAISASRSHHLRHSRNKPKTQLNTPKKPCYQSSFPSAGLPQPTSTGSAENATTSRPRSLQVPTQHPVPKPLLWRMRRPGNMNFLSWLGWYVSINSSCARWIKSFLTFFFS